MAVESPLNLAVMSVESSNILDLISAESVRSFVVMAVESPLNLEVIVVESFTILESTLIPLTYNESSKIEIPLTLNVSRKSNFPINFMPC